MTGPNGPQVGSGHITINYDVDTAAALSKVKSFQKTAEATAKDIKSNIKVDTAGATAQMARWRATMERSGRFSITPDVDSSRILSRQGEFRAIGDRLGREFTDAASRRVARLADEISRDTVSSRRLEEKYRADGDKAGRAFTSEMDKVFKDAVRSGTATVKPDIDRGFGARVRSAVGGAFHGADRDVDVHSRSWGQRAGEAFGGMFEGITSLLPSRLESVFTRTGPAIGAALAGAIGAGLMIVLPAIIAGIAGAGFATLGIGAIAAGILMVKDDPRVTSAADEVSKSFHDRIWNSKGAEAMVQSTVRALGMLRDNINQWAPTISGIFEHAAQMFDKVATGFNGLIDNVMPALGRLFDSPFMQNLAQILSDSLVKIGQAISDFINRILNDPQALQGIQMAFEDLMNLIPSLIRLLGDVIIWAGKTWAKFNTDPDGAGPALSGMEAMKKAWKDFRDAIQPVIDLLATVLKYIQWISADTNAPPTDRFQQMQQAADAANNNVPGSTTKGLTDNASTTGGPFSQKNWQDTGQGFQDLPGQIAKTFKSFKDQGPKAGLDSLFGGGKDGKSAMDQIKEMSPMLMAVSIAIDTVKAHWDEFWTSLKTIVTNGIEAVKTIVTNGVEAVKTVWNTGWGWVKAKATEIWNGILSFFQGVWAGIQTGLSTALTWIQTTWNTVWGAISSFFSGIWNWIVTTAQTAWTWIVGVFNTSLTWIQTTWNTVWSAISTFFSGIWTWIVTTAQTAWAWVVGIYNSSLQWIQTTWNTVWDAIATWFGDIWRNIQAWAQSSWDWIVGIYQSSLAWIQNTWNSVWDAIATFFGDIWENIKAWASTAMQWVSDTIHNILDTIHEKWNDVWTGIAEIASGVWDNIKSAVAQGIDSVIGILNQGIAAINAVLDKLGVGFKIDPIGTIGNSVGASSGPAYQHGVFKADGGPIQQGLAGGGRVRGPGGPRDDLVQTSWRKGSIGGHPPRVSPDEYVMNARASKQIGMSQLDFMNRFGKLPVHNNVKVHPPGLAGGGDIGAAIAAAKAAASAAGHGKKIVWKGANGDNEGLMNEHRDHVHVGMGSVPMSTDPGGNPAINAIAAGSGIPNHPTSGFRAGDLGGRSWHAKGKATDFGGFNQDALAMFFARQPGISELIHRSATGDYGIFNGAGSILNEFLAKGIAWVMSNMINPALDKASGMLPNNGIGALAKGVVGQKMKDALKKKIEEFITASNATGGGGSGGGSAPQVQGRWGSVLQQAMQLTGVPASWLGPLSMLISRESGGNPRSINTTDSNAQRGDPSRGLMQTIGSTFNAYRNKGLSADIYDPLSNVVAGINYIKARYGDIHNVQQAVGSTPKGYDNGGFMMPGLGMHYNGTSQPEAVLTGPQWDSIMKQPAAAEGDTYIQVYIDDVPVDANVKVKKNNQEITQGLKRGRG